MATLDDYETLVAIMETGSLTAAARRLGRSLQSVSRSLGLLERDLGVTLIRRTTRRLQPARPAGAPALRRVRAANQVNAELGRSMMTPAGRSGCRPDSDDRSVPRSPQQAARAGRSSRCAAQAARAAPRARVRAANQVNAAEAM